ncbi:entericidin like toxin protein [Clostridia bacterium]|nr:entericidin like toxin protein [Clostridia bacterium]
MRGQELLDKMELVDSKYVEEAGAMPVKKNLTWIKWSAMAACLVLVGLALISLFPGRSNDIVTTPYIADLAPMVYVNDNVYKQSTKQIAYDEPKEEFAYLGKVESYLANDQGVPKENLQSNTRILGAPIFQYGNDIVIQIKGKYWLYELLSDESEDSISEQEKMELDPTYTAE